VKTLSVSLANNENSRLLIVGLAFLTVRSKTRKAERIYWFTFQSRKRMKTDGVSGGPITQALI